MKIFWLVLFLSSFAISQTPLTTVGAGAGVTSTALPTWTIVQHPLTTGCSGTTCSVTLTQAFAAGNVKVVQAQFAQNNVSIVSDTKGGTLTQCPSTLGGDLINGSHPIAYTLNTSSSTTGADVITFSASTAANVRVIELHPSSGSPAAALDFCNSLVLPSSGTTYNATGATMSGGNDVVLVQAATANSLTAVNSPYSSNQDLTGGNLWATALNQTSVTAPTYTVDVAGQTSVGLIGFGFNPTACVDQGFQGFEGGANNTAVTEALLRAGNKGWQGAQWDWFTSTAMKFQTAASKDLLNTGTRMCGDGTQALSSGSTLGVEYSSSSGANTYITATVQTNGTGSFGLPIDNVSAGVWFKHDWPDNSTDPVLDVFSIGGYAGGDFATAQFLANAGNTKRCLHVESTLGQAAGCIDINTATWYWLSLEYNKAGNAALKVYDSSGSLLGTSTKAMANTTQPVKWVVGQLSSSVPTTGFHLDFDGLVLNLAGGPIPN